MTRDDIRRMSQETGICRLIRPQRHEDMLDMLENFAALVTAALKETVPSDCADSHQPVTIERLRDALVASRIIDPAAVEDPDEYDDGVTLFRVEALHRRIT